MCNAVGNREWTLAMDWTHADKYRKAELVNFKSAGKKAGKTQAYTPDNGAGLLRYLQVKDAGHMVPYGGFRSLLLRLHPRTLFPARPPPHLRPSSPPPAPRPVPERRLNPTRSTIADQPAVSLDFFQRWIANKSFE